MVHIKFWFMRMMLTYWEEVCILYRKTQKLWWWLVGRWDWK